MGRRKKQSITVGNIGGSSTTFGMGVVATNGYVTTSSSHFAIPPGNHIVGSVVTGNLTISQGGNNTNVCVTTTPNNSHTLPYVNNNGFNSTVLETKDLDVKIMIDRCMLGWLSAITKQPAKEVMCHLYDLSTGVIESVKGRNGTWCSRKLTFPDTGIVLKVSAARHYDEDLYVKTHREWWQRCKLALGTDTINVNYANPEYAEWCKTNPEPLPPDYRFHYIRCRFSLPNGETTIVMSQNEMDNLMTETFLLGDSNA